jgi:hypothetical protein
MPLHQGGPPVSVGGPSLLFALAVSIGLPLTLAYKTGPPAGHTGGFGEPTCHTCHSDDAPNPAGGSLEVIDFPESYIPGQEYQIHVRVRGKDLGRAGFQLAVRFANGQAGGTNAGSLEAMDARTSVIAAPKTGVQYAQHLIAGVTPLWTDSTQWTLRWTAPLSGEPVVLHIAANASNNDESEYGDRIYHTALTSGAAMNR